MPTGNDYKAKVVDQLRHIEHYDLQDEFDELYRKSSDGETFQNLMDIILSRRNILLAYRNIKANKGSQVPGTDHLTIKNVAKLTSEEVVENVRFIMVGSVHGYRPKPVRRKEILKQDGSKRPFGIPCIWDRLVQQSIKQVLEPICEAKFSTNSYGFRPNRCAEHTIAETHRLLQRSKLGYVVEVELNEFFDNINHSKLIRQLWTLGIRDKQLLFVIKRMLKTPEKTPGGELIIPQKGIVQAGVLSSLLSNVALNELDQWVDSQWLKNPVIDHFKLPRNKSGKLIKSNAYLNMRKTRLKEVYLIRYADDIRIFCRTYQEAERIKIALIQWLETRLKATVSQEKTRIINLRRRYMELLGFKIKLYQKGNGWKVKSHISDRKFEQIQKELKWQFVKIAHVKNKQHEMSVVRRYNAMVMGVQNYYQIATDICKDLRVVQYRISAIAKSRLHTKNSCKSRLERSGRTLTSFEKGRYGASRMLRYIKSSGEPIYPIGYLKPKPPISKRESVCSYSKEGRKGLYDSLSLDRGLLIDLMKHSSSHQSIEFNDNKLALLSAQMGRCSVTQRKFRCIQEIHCHHKHPREKGGGDEYSNLTLVLEEIHQLIHAKKRETIERYLALSKLTKNELERVNRLRELADLNPIMG